MVVPLDGVDQVLIERAIHAARGVQRHGRQATLSLDDDEVSRTHARLVATPGGWELIDLDSTNGTTINHLSVRSQRLADGDVIEIGHSLLVFREDADEDFPSTRPELRSVHRGLARQYTALTQVAASSVPVLLRGETGTGKELAARAVHTWSGRPGPFVAVNCGALPSALVESELFGYRRGAFSGASEDRVGLVQRAHGGTLFLDEIADLRPESQASLLRVLQERELRAVGSTDPTHVDLRVVAATHQDLELRLADHRFRADLYARVAGHVVVLPPLRDRREDIGLLVAAVLRRFAPPDASVSLSRSAARALFRYEYPLNVRELEHAIRGALALARGGPISLSHLPQTFRVFRPISRAPSPPSPEAPALRPADRELRDRLTRALAQHGGNVAAVARSFETQPFQIRRWCSRLGIDLRAFRSPSTVPAPCRHCPTTGRRKTKPLILRAPRTALRLHWSPAMPKPKPSRLAIITLLLCALTACASRDDDDDAPDRRACERYIDHLIELRLEGSVENRAAHKAALAASLGSDAIDHCITTMGPVELDCVARVATLEAARACSTTP
jgi:DNA-binding NtrC family response regulator